MKTLPAPADIPADRPAPYFATWPPPPEEWERLVQVQYAAARRGLPPAA